MNVRVALGRLTHLRRLLSHFVPGYPGIRRSSAFAGYQLENLKLHSTHYYTGHMLCPGFSSSIKPLASAPHKKHKTHALTTTPQPPPPHNPQAPLTKQSGGHHRHHSPILVQAYLLFSTSRTRVKGYL